MATMTNATVITEVDTIDLLQQKLDSLKRNEANIPKEELNRKYQKAYNNLLAEIKQLAGKLMIERCFYFWVPKAFKDEGRRIIEIAVKKKSKRITLSLRRSYSSTEYAQILDEIKTLVINQFFASGIPGDSHEMYSLNPWYPEKMVLINDKYIRSYDSTETKENLQKELM